MTTTMIMILGRNAAGRGGGIQIDGGAGWRDEGHGGAGGRGWQPGEEGADGFGP